MNSQDTFGHAKCFYLADDSPRFSPIAIRGAFVLSLQQSVRANPWTTVFVAGRDDDSRFFVRRNSNNSYDTRTKCFSLRIYALNARTATVCICKKYLYYAVDQEASDTRGRGEVERSRRVARSPTGCKLARSGRKQEGLGKNANVCDGQTIFATSTHTTPRHRTNTNQSDRQSHVSDDEVPPPASPWPKHAVTCSVERCCYGV